MKGWVGLVGWPTADGLPTKWSPVSYGSSAGEGKFAGQKLTFYHWATQPSIQPTYSQLKHYLKFYWDEGACATGLPTTEILPSNCINVISWQMPMRLRLSCCASVRPNWSWAPGLPPTNSGHGMIISVTFSQNSSNLTTVCYTVLFYIFHNI